MLTFAALDELQNNLCPLYFVATHRIQTLRAMSPYAHFERGAAIRARMTYSISSRLVIAPLVSLRNVFRRAVFWARHMGVLSSLAVC